MRRKWMETKYIWNHSVQKMQIMYMCVYTIGSIVLWSDRLTLKTEITYTFLSVPAYSSLIKATTKYTLVNKPSNS